jgi:hypothetical protein
VLCVRLGHAVSVAGDSEIQIHWLFSGPVIHVASDLADSLALTCVIKSDYPDPTTLSQFFSRKYLTLLFFWAVTRLCTAFHFFVLILCCDGLLK